MARTFHFQRRLHTHGYGCLGTLYSRLARKPKCETPALLVWVTAHGHAVGRGLLVFRASAEEANRRLLPPGLFHRQPVHRGVRVGVFAGWRHGSAASEKRAEERRVLQRRDGQKEKNRLRRSFEFAAFDDRVADRIDGVAV